AEPDSANGVSGPPGAKWGDKFTMINNNPKPFGGPINTAATAVDIEQGNCPWTANNCGPNDEAFSFHGSGANALFADGSVRFTRQDIAPLTFRKLLTPAEQDGSAPDSEY